MTKTLTVKELRELLKNYKDTDEIQLAANPYEAELTIETDNDSIELLTLDI